MARPRKHDQNRILDAVERVIARDGVLTLDAVAQEADVSKATVIYDHTSKRELLAAVVERAIRADNAFNEECAARFAGKPNATLYGRVEAARRTPPVEDGNPAVLSLIAALLQDASLRQRFHANQVEIRAKLLGDASLPSAATLAWLALEGLKFQQHMELANWSDTERAAILDQIENLARTGRVTLEASE